MISQIIIPTSDVSVGLPEIKNKSFKENPDTVLDLSDIFIVMSDGKFTGYSES